jgi:hypothetical protein
MSSFAPVVSKLSSFNFVGIPRDPFLFKLSAMSSFAPVVSKLSSFNFVGIPRDPFLFKLTIYFIPDQIFFTLQELLLK